MKGIISLLASLLVCLNMSAQSAVEYFEAGNPINYCGTDYHLAWSVRPIENYYVQEYLPEGETLERYNQMFTVAVVFCDLTPLDAVKAKIAELDQRKQSDPIVNYMVAENNGEYILEFIVSDSRDGEMNTVEVDVHHYKQMTINGRKASVLGFYSSRAYGDDIKPFIQSIPDKRNTWYEGMNTLKLNPSFPKKNRLAAESASPAGK